MFALKVFSLLVLAFVANGTDLETGLEIMACARSAILVGVPELGVPSHEPLLHLKTEFNYDQSLVIADAIVNITNMTWAGLARWKLTADQVSKDTDSLAKFNFELYWEWMELAGDYRVEEKAIFFDEVQEGTFALEFNKTSWIGSIDLTKAGATPSQKNGSVEDVQINWHVDKVGLELTGLGSIIDAAVVGTLKTTIKGALNNNLIGNTVGDFVKMRLKTIWWDTGKVWDLVNWCQENNITSIY